MKVPFLISFIVFSTYVIGLKGSFVAASEQRKDYIVYMGALPTNSNYSPKAHHMALLQQVLSKSNAGHAEQYLIRSYTRSFNGFVAHVTEAEAKMLSGKEEVVVIFPSKTLQLHTTESWNFVGLNQTAHRNLTTEGDIIIGLLDTGIWPESKSFNDNDFGPIPKKWNGECQGGKNFTCNKKMIGARSYTSESCRDLNGHGSHTASTAAGNNVENTSFYGIAEGAARGGVTSARIAAYKVCTNFGCDEQNILAAFDDAIADGVDILSVSLGTTEPISLDKDVVAIGSFHAAKKGILTVQSAGNSGPASGLVSSVAPWLFTVAASTTDRKIVTKVELGNGKVIEGYSVNSFVLNGTKFPVVYGTDASKGCDAQKAKSCYSNCLDKKLVKGKILMCDTSGVTEAADVEALGLIFPEDNRASANVSETFPYPISVLNDEQFALAASYYNSTKNPTMNILKSEGVKDMDAPVVAAFSSRGPNEILPDILKPDIGAPGVDILAAFSPESHPSDYDQDNRSVSYSILSGTSMSCPHVAGTAGYVKSLHPNWSPSAIKSALMTTASQMKSGGTNGDNEFSYGAGHLDPVKAADPGIVYETTIEDYIKMLCGMDITSSKVSKVSGYNITCDSVDKIKAKDLNYPSMAAKVDKDGEFKVEFSRTVTNVGSSTSTYKAKITCNRPACDISVVPDTLSFKTLNEQESFVVKVVGQKLGDMISASLEWSDGSHIARSPIVVYS